MAIERLQTFYGIDDINGVPVKEEMSNWTNHNKFGFLTGVLTHHSVYIEEIYSLVGSASFPHPGSKEETDYLHLLYDRCIRPFKQHGRNASNNSSPHPSEPSSISGSSSDLLNLKHADFKAALQARDKICLFCWGRIQLQASHLIAEKSSIARITAQILSSAGLESVYQVQNGVLLCKNCHGEFDALRRYIDVNDDNHLIAKVVNLTNDPNDADVRSDLKGFKGYRDSQLEFMSDVREVINASGEMPIYSVQTDLALSPNRMALQFHKTACLIWRMAGGADVDDADDDMDEDGGDADVGVLVVEKLRSIQAWREQATSAGTLNENE
ncbi:hypothetical protein BDR26DRAFT_803924 [Obelidium mucronatum]|nr:hypothetical protein BDR26DRAFT_803924 [Obelidium mucronatum]